MADESEQQKTTIDEGKEPTKLERRNSLEKQLGKRPDAKDLIGRNILHDQSVAPAIQQHQHELEQQMKADNLKKGLESRPKPEDLINKGILNADEDPTKTAE